MSPFLAWCHNNPLLPFPVRHSFQSSAVTLICSVLTKREVTAPNLTWRSYACFIFNKTSRLPNSGWTRLLPWKQDFNNFFCFLFIFSFFWAEYASRDNFKRTLKVGCAVNTQKNRLTASRREAAVFIWTTESNIHTRLSSEISGSLAAKCLTMCTSCCLVMGGVQRRCKALLDKNSCLLLETQQNSKA